MGLAPYFSRVHDSIGAVAAISADELSELLLDLTVHVRLGTDTYQGAGRSGAVLLTNLLSRLYPRVRLTGSDDLVAELTHIAKATNPAITVNAPGDGRSVEIWFGAQPSPPRNEPGEQTPHTVEVRSTGWRVVLDPSPADSDDASGTQGGTALAREPQPASPLTWQAAACLAAAEVFRYAFRDALGQYGRHTRQPGSFNLLNGGPDDVQVDTDLSGRHLPDLHLAGAGAIGQAALLALRESGVRARVTVVDPQDVELSNLQRYVLSIPTDVGRSKVDVVVEALKGSSVTVTAVQTAWGADERSHPGQQVVLVALDSAHDRLGVAAGMHRRVYNAWTQPSDLGWSRHEDFGQQPCLACLYLPDHVRPSEDEQIAAALGVHRLRILSYFAADLPVGQPLSVVTPVGDVAPPADVDTWLTSSLLSDLVDNGRIGAVDAARWADSRIGQLYNQAVCGAGLLAATPGSLDRDVVVPLAHQSALAGVMLAASVIAAHVPELAGQRPVAAEMRLNLLAGLPQVLPRPRNRTPGCLCADPVFLRASAAEGID